MKKNELISEITAIITNKEYKADKALQEAITKILNDYKSSSSSNKKDEIAQLIEIDGVNYAWCNKHNLYEVADNFAKNKKRANGYHVNCKLSDARWHDISKQIKTANDNLHKAIAEKKWSEVEKFDKEISELKIKRNAIYNIEDDKKAFKEIDSYNYEADYHKLEDTK
jgi:hypothetical protein